MLPKSREVTKIDHTVWPPPINRRKNRKDSHFHSGCVPDLLCAACVKPPQSSSGPGTRCNTTTHTRSHSVHANSLSFRSGRPRMSSFPRAVTTKPTKPANSTNFRIPKQILQIPRISKVSRFRCGGARERRHPERKDSDFRGVALPGIALRVSRKLRAPRRRICEYLVWRNTEYLVCVKK